MKLFNHTILIAVVAALVVAAMPFAGASAMPATGASAQEEIPPERLEQTWARQQRIYERIGNGFDRLDEFITRAQGRLDKAESNGRDVTALQAALDAFKAAADEAYPIYAGGQAIIDAHLGFDGNGKVTDEEAARETVESMRAKLQEIKSTMRGTGRLLREAIRAFREANLRPPPSDTPEG